MSETSCKDVVVVMYEFAVSKHDEAVLQNLLSIMIKDPSLLDATPAGWNRGSCGAKITRFPELPCRPRQSRNYCLPKSASAI